MNKPLLLEIGVEELPAIPLLNESKNIKNKWLAVLEKYRLSSDCEFYFTPRRVVFIHNSFPQKQASFIEEFFGPPVDIAYKDNKPTKAAEGFAKKCGITIEEIKTVEKNSKEILYFKKEILGKDLKAVFGDMVNEFLNSLSFGKTMRWGSLSEGFIRPIRWIVAKNDSEIIEFESFGVKSNEFTHIHRNISFEAKKVESIQNYDEFLYKNGVILSQSKREEKILNDIAKIEQESGLKVQIDRDLLNEVVAITEWPNALLGKFDDKFLTLPNEVIITSMKENQRYFAVYNKRELSNNFVVVSNALTSDTTKIISGNEKVLRPRLADALFFWDNDLKRGLKNDGLEQLTYVDGLGSVLDKVARERKIGAILSSLFAVESNLVDRAIELSKADLMSEMVYEFTELQGVMGEYYAKLQDEDSVVATAIREQYLPLGEDSSLPQTKVGAIVSLSSKLDTIIGLFSIGKIPSGTKDPFALRRAVNGIIQITVDNNFNLDLDELFSKLKELYKNFDYSLLKEFIYERLYNLYKVNPSIVTSVLKSKETNLNNIASNILVVNTFVNNDSFKEQFSTFKRVANIIKDVDLSQNFLIDESLFQKDEERELFKAFSNVKAISSKDLLGELFGLKEKLDAFFDCVMVNDKDEKIKLNRVSLISHIYIKFLGISDIKEISV